MTAIRQRALVEAYASDFGAVMDVTRSGGLVTSGQNVITRPSSTFTAADIGKRLMLIGGGATKTSTTGTATHTGVVLTANLVTDPNTTFTQDDVGKVFVGATCGTAGGVLVARVWSVIDAHTIRLNATIKTTVTGTLAYTISGNLYGVISSISSGGAVLSTAVAGLTPVNAGVTVTSTTKPSFSNCFYGTDDTAAIQACVNALPNDANGRVGGTIVMDGMSALSASISTSLANLKIRGVGGQGLSVALGVGRSGFVMLAPGQPAFLFGLTRAGANGAMTSGAATLVDNNASFTSDLVAQNISVIGAGTQTGSCKMIRLQTTVKTVDSATQLTLNANAAATVTNAGYSISSISGNVQNSFTLEGLYVQGHSECPAAIAYCAKNVRLLEVTASDCLNGFNIFAANPNANGTNDYARLATVVSMDARVLYMVQSPANTHLTGCYFDGNHNIPAGIEPGENTYGIMTTGKVQWEGGVCAVVGRCIYADGQTSGSGIALRGVKVEGMTVAVECSSDASLGGDGHFVWLDSGVTGESGAALAVQFNASVKHSTIIDAGSGTGLSATPYSIDATCSGITIHNPGTFTVDGQTMSGFGYKAAASGIWVGMEQYVAAAPTTGAHIVGERVWNVAPAASGTMGWVCTTAGTPGTWKTFGAISA